jgi:hypothetical protein
MGDVHKKFGNKILGPWCASGALLCCGSVDSYIGGYVFKYVVKYIVIPCYLHYIRPWNLKPPQPVFRA